MFANVKDFRENKFFFSVFGCIPENSPKNILQYLIQSCRYHFGLGIGMVYFGTGQYRRFVSGLPLYIYLLIYMFIHQNL
jgi:hypothetical protein